jgi:hypothetical protein
MREGGNKMLNAFVLILVAGCFVAQMCGLAFRIHRLASNNHKKPDDVSESVVDTDGDGRPDVWEVNVGRFQPYQCSQTLEDSDGDGTPDVLTVVTAHIACKMFDDAKKGGFDRQAVAIANVSDENSGYEYQDLDLDGRLDVMVHKEGDQTVDSYVFMKNTLLRVQLVPTYDPRQAWISQPDGTQRMMVFENGGWRFAGE